MAAFLNVIVGAIITGIIGNLLVQKWQLGSWFAQQKHLSVKDEIDQLHMLFEDLTDNANNRLYRTRSFLRSLSLEEEYYEKKKLEYASSVANWMKKLSIYYSRITIYYTYSQTQRLESDIHKNFVEISQKVEGLYEKRKLGRYILPSEKRKIEDSINRVQGELTDFSRDFLSFIVNKRREFINGKEVYYNDGYLEHFTTLQLIKLLFSADIDRPYIIRTTGPTS